MCKIINKNVIKNEGSKIFEPSSNILSSKNLH